MNKHLILTLLTIILVGGMTSCLKDDVSSTIIYSSQAIPDINTYMPSRLIKLMNDNGLLYYGDEPPRFSGLYHIDSILELKVDTNYLAQVPGNCGHIFFEGKRMGAYDFTFYDQIRGILSSKYSTRYNIPELQAGFEIRSTIDTTYHYLKSSLAPITSCPDCPSYFANGDVNPKVFKNAYIIGDESHFTIFYYDIPIYLYDYNWLHPIYPGVELQTNSNLILMANIISGKLVEIPSNDSESTGSKDKPNKQYRIIDFYWGVEAIGAIKEGESIWPVPGDAEIRYNYNKPITPTFE